MKKILFVLCMILLSSIICSAQDLIVKQDGTSFIAYITDISDKAIYYTVTDSEDAQIQKILKSNVLIIKYKDGTTRQFLNEGTASDQESHHISNTNSKEVDPNRDDAAANERQLKKYTYIKGKIPEKYAQRKADASLLHYAPTSSSVLSNKDIEVNYILNDASEHSNNRIFYNPTCEYGYLVNDTESILVSIENKTDQFIYIDLARSYFKLAGISHPYYTPSAVSKSDNTSAGASVNLGGVANTLGIGGVVGGLANAINVGGGSSETVSNISFSQRIVSVAPHSKIYLNDQLLFPNKSFAAFPGMFKRFTAWGLLLNPAYKALTVGSVKAYREGEIDSGWGTIITYGFTEEVKQTFSLEANFYLKSIYGFRQGWSCSSMTECYEPFKDVIVIECINLLH